MSQSISTEINSEQAAKTYTENFEAEGKAIEAMYATPETSNKEGTKPTEQSNKADVKEGEKDTSKASVTEGYETADAGDSTGYGEGGEKPAAESKSEEPKLEYDLSLDGLKEEDAAEMKKFLIDKKVPKEIAERLVQEKKAQVDAVDKFLADAKKQAEVKLVETRKQWVKELKEDKDFGGDRFKTSLSEVDAIVNKFLPNTKKLLTESGGMLPPSVMRDIHALHKVLMGTESNVMGTAAKPNASQENFLDDLYK